MGKSDSWLETDLISCLEVFVPDSSCSDDDDGDGHLQRAFPSADSNAMIKAALH